MSRIRSIVTEHQLVSFFVLTHLGTWLLALPFFLMGENPISGILALVGLFCPAFANILISRAITPVTDENPRAKRRIAFWVTLIAATAIFALHVETTSGIASPVAIVFYAIIGLLPAIVLASTFSRLPAVRKSLSSIISPKGHVGWYLFALLMPWVTKLIGIPITNRLGWEPIYEPDLVASIPSLVGLIAVSFFYMLVFAGGLNEETGWTGLALPRLQSRFSPLVASMILWFFWILWHIPFQVAGAWNSELESFIRALIGSFFARFIFTWLYNKTRGGTLSAILLHASANVSFEFLPTTHVGMILEAVLAIVLVVGDRMWQKLPAGSRAVHEAAPGAGSPDEGGVRHATV
jgi:membrane protease YdiL (CAAX protease family)